MISDPAVDFPQDQFERVQNVIVFDAHEGARTVKGKPLVVDDKYLQQIADNNNLNYREKKCPVVLGLGHTKDDDSADEQEQPEVVGWATDFKVVPFFRTGKKALSCDWYIRKEKANVIRDYPGRSVELYPATAETPFIALLRKVPERNLPVIKYSADPDGDRYYYHFQSPAPEPVNLLSDPNPVTRFSREPVMPSDTVQPMVDAAVADEGKTNKSLEAKVDRLTGMFEQLMTLLSTALQDDPDGEDGDDLLQPDDTEIEAGDEKPKAKDSDSKGKDEKKPEPEPEKKQDEPVKMGADSATATNVYPNSTDDNKNKDKVKMSRDNDEVLKFKKIAEDLAKDNTEFRLKFNRMKAEKTVADWEANHNILFPSPEAKAAEIELLAHLDDNTFAAHEKRALLLYSRKKPAGEAVREVSRFARQPESEQGPLKSAEDVAAFVSALDSGRITGSYEEALAKFSGKKTV